MQFEDWLRGLPSVPHDDVVGQLQARENLAARGGLLKDAIHKIEPVSSYDDMFEMKWDWREPRTDECRYIRQYHAEPPSVRAALVRLHRHLKQVDVPELVKARQQVEIDFAKHRFDTWSGVGSTTPG